MEMQNVEMVVNTPPSSVANARDLHLAHLAQNVLPVWAIIAFNDTFHAQISMLDAVYNRQRIQGPF